MFDFSIILATVGRREEVGICLHSIQENFLNSKMSYEVIVVDQNPVDFGLKKVCDQFSNLKYIHSDKKGLSFNRNIGIKASSGKWFVFADDDCIYREAYFKNVHITAKGLDYRDLLLVITNAVNLEDDQPYGSSLNSKLRDLSILTFDRICSIGFVMSSGILATVGHFDESFGVGAKYGACEETDLILRAYLKKAKAVVCENSYVAHPIRSKRRFESARSLSYARGFGAFYRKSFTSVNRPIDKLIILLKFVKNCLITFLGIAIFFFKPKKCFHYIQILKVKINSFLFYKSDQ